MGKAGAAAEGSERGRTVLADSVSFRPPLVGSLREAVLCYLRPRPLSPLLSLFFFFHF